MNYLGFFICSTSREISDLEGQLLSMRNLLSTQAALVHGLSEGVHIDSLSTGPEDSAGEDVLYENKELSNIENWLVEFLDTLEVLLSERRVVCSHKLACRNFLKQTMQLFIGLQPYLPGKQFSEINF